jgi:hypothetical protein
MLRQVHWHICQQILLDKITHLFAGMSVESNELTAEFGNWPRRRDRIVNVTILDITKSTGLPGGVTRL